MSIDTLTTELVQIKTGSEQLSQMILMASQNLQSQSTQLFSVGRGKGTIERAANQVLAASKSLSDAAGCMITLSRDIDSVLSEIRL